MLHGSHKGARFSSQRNHIFRIHGGSHSLHLISYSGHICSLPSLVKSKSNAIMDEAFISPQSNDGSTYNPFPAACRIHSNHPHVENSLLVRSSLPIGHRFVLRLRGSHISKTDLYRQLSMQCLAKVDEIFLPSVFLSTFPSLLFI